jgi:hypothetical protein
MADIHTLFPSDVFHGNLPQNGGSGDDPTTLNAAIFRAQHANNKVLDHLESDEMLQTRLNSIHRPDSMVDREGMAWGYNPNSYHQLSPALQDVFTQFQGQELAETQQLLAPMLAEAQPLDLEDIDRQLAVATTLLRAKEEDAAAAGDGDPVFPPDEDPVAARLPAPTRFPQPIPVTAASDPAPTTTHWTRQALQRCLAGDMLGVQQILEQDARLRQIGLVMLALAAGMFVTVIILQALWH